MEKYHIKKINENKFIVKRDEILIWFSILALFGFELYEQKEFNSYKKAVQFIIEECY